MSMGLKAAVDNGPMSRFQLLAIGICIVLNMIDGFDVLVMAFTAASVSAEWALNGAQIGLLLSAGLFGMAAGSLFIAAWRSVCSPPAMHLGQRWAACWRSGC